jgi:hypothetical protein
MLLGSKRPPVQLRHLNIESRLSKEIGTVSSRCSFQMQGITLEAVHEVVQHICSAKVFFWVELAWNWDDTELVWVSPTTAVHARALMQAPSLLQPCLAIGSSESRLG